MMENDFEKFHDEIVMENAQLKAKIGALKEFVKSSIFLLMETKNYNHLLSEYYNKELKLFDEISRKSEVYCAKSLSDKRREYLLNLNYKIEEVKNSNYHTHKLTKS